MGSLKLAITLAILLVVSTQASAQCANGNCAYPAMGTVRYQYPTTQYQYPTTQYQYPTTQYQYLPEIRSTPVVEVKKTKASFDCDCPDCVCPNCKCVTKKSNALVFNH